MFDSLNISASGLRAQRITMDTISRNIASANATRDAAGNPNPYRRLEVLVKAGAPAFGVPYHGVEVSEIREDVTTDFRRVMDPNHPDAIKTGKDKGIVLYPNVDVMHEMVDMIVATRAYEATVTAMDAAKSIAESSMRILA
jgi:flagellar basal-body rod protein FlgC